ncbi:MAG: glycosyltransferase family 4 protein [Candidatus Zixiibacteriota bacterium]
MNQNTERIVVYSHPGSVEAEFDHAATARRETMVVVGVTAAELEDTAPQTALVLRQIALERTYIEHCSVDPAPAAPRPGWLFGLSHRLRFLLTMLRKLRSAETVCVVPLPDRFGVAPAMITLVFARFLGKYTVLDCTSYYIEPVLEKWRRPLVPLMRCADRILVTSPSLAERIGKYGLDALGVGPLLDSDSFECREVREVQPKLLSVLPLEPSMNVGCVIQAFRLVKQKYPRAELLIAGEGSQRDALESIIAAERIGSVTFIGHVRHDEMECFFQQADLCVCGASRDDLPYSLFEALASGLPVVTTDAGAIPDYLTDGQTCLMVSLNDHVAMAEKVIALVENPELTARLSRNGRRLAEQFSSDRKGSDIRRLYRRPAN